MRELIRGLRGEHTILLSSHILSEIERTCDRILMLHNGRIVATGTEEELVTQMHAQPSTYRDALPQHWVELEVRGTEDAVKTALTISGVDVVELSRGADGVCRVKVKCPRDERELIAQRVVQSGLGLLTIQRTQSALEDVFVRLSREDEEEVEA